MSENEDGGVEPQKIQVASAGGKSWSEISKSADRVVEKQKGRYIEHLANDIKEIKRFLPLYLNAPSAETMKPLFNCVHNMRGQGTLFDYPLVTAIGGEFCRYIDGLPADATPREDVVRKFVDLLEFVHTENLSGEGGPEIQEVTRNMRLMVDKFISA